MSKIYNSIGTMSGTSFDGIDVSLISTNGQDIFDVQNNLYEKFNKQIKSNLKKIKENKKLKNIALVKQSRLSVMPINKIEWEEIIKMSSMSHY